MYGMRPAAPLSKSDQKLWRMSCGAGIALSTIASLAWFYWDTRVEQYDALFMNNSIDLHLKAFWLSIMLYLPFAALQQYIVLHLLRIVRASQWCGTNHQAALVTAALFGLAHAPMWELIFPCAVGSYAWNRYYLALNRWPFIALAHAVSAVFLLSFQTMVPLITAILWSLIWI